VDNLLEIIQVHIINQEKEVVEILALQVVMVS
jgi:hypothetical protein